MAFNDYYFRVGDNPIAVAHLAVAASFVAALCQLQKRRRRNDEDEESTSPSPPSDRLAAKLDFLRRVGSSYGYANSEKGFIDNWRLSEFPTLIPPLMLPHDKQPAAQSLTSEHQCATSSDDGPSEQEVYLDYAGSAIPTQTLLSRISNNPQVLANPHSEGGGLASDRTLKYMKLARDCVMKHFGVDDENIGCGEIEQDDMKVPCPGYQLVFTSGTTESLRLVAERFPWSFVKVTADGKSKIHTCDGNIDSTNQLESVKVCSVFLFPKNVHTSVIGIRQVALQRGAQFHCASVDDLVGATSVWFENVIRMYMEMKAHISEEKSEVKKDAEPRIYHADKTIWVHHLLALPLECNLSGDLYDWSNTAAAARNSSFSTYLHCLSENNKDSIKIRVRHKWHVFIDVAKAAATGPVNLPTLTHGGPDFVAVSFYKMFGAPTGLGALFVKKAKHKIQLGGVSERINATDELPDIDTSNATTRGLTNAQHLNGGITIKRSMRPRHFFGGGSVDVVLADRDFVVTRKKYDAWQCDEDESIDLGVMVHGTEHFRGIASLTHCFLELSKLGGMKAVSTDRI